MLQKNESYFTPRRKENILECKYVIKGNEKSSNRADLFFFIHFYTLKEEPFNYQRVLKSNKKIYSLRLMKYIMEIMNEK